MAAVVYRLNLIIITLPVIFFSAFKKTLNFICKHNFREAKYSYIYTNSAGGI